MIRSLILTSVVALSAAPAIAGTSFTAKLATPAEKGAEFIAEKAIWSCSADTCTAELSRRSVTVRTCKKVAEEIGVLADFSNGEESLDEADLAECNEAAAD